MVYNIQQNIDTTVCNILLNIDTGEEIPGDKPSNNTFSNQKIFPLSGQSAISHPAIQNLKSAPEPLSTESGKRSLHSSWISEI